MDNKGRRLRWAPSGAMKSGKRSEQIRHKRSLSKRGLGLDAVCGANESHSFVDRSDRGKLFPCCLTTRPSLIPLHQFTCHRRQFAASLSPLVHSRQQCQPALCVLCPCHFAPYQIRSAQLGDPQLSRWHHHRPPLCAQASPRERLD